MDRFEQPILTPVPAEGAKGTNLSAVFSPALARAAWTGFMRAAQALKSDGSFAGFAGLASYADINDFLASDLRTRQVRGEKFLPT